ncbi:MAG: single-stranded DNA-binding protein [Bryobacterales bacterium]|nr:single-stranded DNA-binding protein [Bryobacterales bacterium]
MVFYGELAEIALSYEKGDNVHAEGTLQTRKFTPRDGKSSHPSSKSSPGPSIC